MWKKIRYFIFSIPILTAVLVFVYLHYYSNEELILEENENLQKNRILVTTHNGKIAGIKGKYEENDVSIFLGIPYALPPINSLRFQKPVPVAKWDQTLEANRWPNPCLQKDNSLRLNNYNFSEDCLYLNIWSPTFVSNNTKLKPVLVVIHTGAFVFGSASETTYNGIVLSSKGDVIVVTFNYRLNLYGFLYTGTEKVSPNAGMYDQVLALQWINDNIKYFGGNSDMITIFGQSSGSFSVGLHILSPISRHLFSNAVMISGSPLQHYWLSEPETAKQFWINYAKEVNCNGREEIISNKVLDCMIKLGRNRLPSMTDAKRYSIDPFVVEMPVVYDKQFYPTNPIKMLLSGDFKKNFSLLFGYTNDEGSWMLSLEDKNKFGPKTIQNMSLEEGMHELNNNVKKIKSNTMHSIDEQKISNHYFNAIPKSRTNDSDLISRTIGIALGDFYIGCPAHHFANSIFKSNQTNVYQYYWTYKGDPKSSSFWNTFQSVWCGKWMGSCHSFELYAIFGVPFQQSIAFNDKDRQISSKIIQIISYFAYHNKPAPQKYNEWHQFKEVDGKVIKQFHRITYKLEEKQAFGIDLKHVECDSLWKLLLTQ